jgi:hypothetical protein
LVEIELLNKEEVPTMYGLLAKAEVEDKASVIEAVVVPEEEHIFNQASALGVDPMGSVVETKLVDKEVVDSMGSNTVAEPDVVDKSVDVEAVLVHQEDNDAALDNTGEDVSAEVMREAKLLGLDSAALLASIFDYQRQP